MKAGNVRVPDVYWFIENTQFCFTCKSSLNPQRLGKLYLYTTSISFYSAVILCKPKQKFFFSLHSLKSAWGKNLSLFSADEKFVCRLHKHHISGLLLHLFSLPVNCLEQNTQIFSFDIWTVYSPWEVKRSVSVLRWFNLIYWYFISNCWNIHKKPQNLPLPV